MLPGSLGPFSTCWFPPIKKTKARKQKFFFCVCSSKDREPEDPSAGPLCSPVAPRWLFFFLAMLVPSEQQLMFCQALIRAPPLCAQRTRVLTHSSSSLLETSLESPRSSLLSKSSPEELGGHGSIASSRSGCCYCRSAWRLWTILPADSSTLFIIPEFYI